MTARPAGPGARPPRHRARVSAGAIGAVVPGPGRGTWLQDSGSGSGNAPSASASLSTARARASSAGAAAARARRCRAGSVDRARWSTAALVACHASTACLAFLGRGQLHGTPVAGRGGPAQHSPRAERVHDGGDGVGPHVQQPGQLAGTGAGMLGQRREQLKLGDGQRVARVGDTGAAPQGTAQPGDPRGQAIGRAAAAPTEAREELPGLTGCPPFPGPARQRAPARCLRVIAPRPRSYPAHHRTVPGRPPGHGSVSRYTYGSGRAEDLAGIVIAASSALGAGVPGAGTAPYGRRPGAVTANEHR